MARKRKPAVSSYERRQWLEELEKGKGITQIASDAGRDIRVVKHHIDIALQEREVTRARHDFLVGRLEQHQEDLLNDVRRIRSRVMQFPPHNLEPDDILERKVHDGFKEHIRHVLLKDLREGLQSFHNLVGEYDEMRRKFEKKLLAKEKKLVSTLPQGLILYPWTPRIMEVLDAGGDSGLPYAENKQEDGTYMPSWGAYKLTKSSITKTDLDMVLKAHRKLTSELERYKPLVQEHRLRHAELVGPIAEKLDVISVKRWVPGRCQYCPF